VLQTTYTYEPYGTTSVSGTSSTNPLRFIGREEDSTGALSLYNLRARPYSPVLGRFVSEDPIGLAGGDLDLYAYAGDAPTIGTDGVGLCSQQGALSGDLSAFQAFFVWVARNHVGWAVTPEVATNLARLGEHSPWRRPPSSSSRTRAAPWSG
jgi:RHS repeat-associated protein